MFPYMIIETIDTHFQNGRPKRRHFFTSMVLKTGTTTWIVHGDLCLSTNKQFFSQNLSFCNKVILSKHPIFLIM